MANINPEEHLDEQQLVVFMLANEAYGVDINTVREIIRMQQITNVPRTPEFVDGVINLRGKVIPIVNLRRRFGLPVAELTDDNRIVWVDVQGTDIGMIVDAVSEVTRIKTDSVEAPSSVITTAESDFVAGIAKTDDHMIILLDLDRVVEGATEPTDAPALQAAA
ncbi:MAG: chemotaxis protein CheW [Chloroflexi bacterium]|nr:chemotaxis protein CheW [Chloroflexota bacterium]